MESSDIDLIKDRCQAAFVATVVIRVTRVLDEVFAVFIDGVVCQVHEEVV